MLHFKHVTNLVIPLTSVIDVVRDLRSKGLQDGKDFDFDYVATVEYDDFNVPLYDHIRFSFKEGKWTTYLLLKYG